MYSSIKTAIINKLTAITGIKNVYGYEKGDLVGYPSAVVTLAGIETPPLDNRSDTRQYSFKIRLYQEMEDDGIGAETAEGRIEALIDSVIGAFEDDYTLGGLVYNVSLRAEMGYSDRGVNTRAFDITLDVFAIYNLNTTFYD